MVSRHDKNVYGGHWVGIPECHDFVVLIDYVCRYFSLYYRTEDAVACSQFLSESFPHQFASERDRFAIDLARGFTP